MTNAFLDHKNLINCDSCNKDIKMTIQTSRLEADVQKVYFICDHCDKEYFCYATNDESRKIQKKIKKERNFLKKKEMQKEHQAITAKLNEKHRPKE